MAFASRSVGLTFITQAITGAKIAIKAIENEASAEGIAILFDLKRRQASSRGLRLFSPESGLFTANIHRTLVIEWILYKDARVDTSG